jgi:hypothetical protein
MTAFGRTCPDVSQTLHLTEAAGSRPLASHPPFISVFTGRSGEPWSPEQDRANVHEHTTHKEKA